MASVPLPAPTVLRRPLVDSVGWVAAANVWAQHPQPAFDCSAMDGYALAIDSLQPLGPYVCQGTTAAGDPVAAPLQPGQAQRVFTGAPVPAGCHAVVMQEYVQMTLAQASNLQQLMLTQPCKPGQHVRRRGSELTAQQVLLHQGERLHPWAVALLASQGVADLAVYQRPRVGVLSTGNELQDPGQPLAPGHIYDANRPQLLALLQAWGAEGLDLGRVADDEAATTQLLQQAAQRCDLIVTSGGASVGDADHLHAAVARLGGLTHGQVAIKPGKPFAHGQVLGVPLLALPGNPVAAAVTLLLLGRPWVQRLCGALNNPAPQVWVPLAQPVVNRDSRPHYLCASWHDAHPGPRQVRPLPLQGAAAVLSLAQADALLEVPPGAELQAGQLACCHPLR